MRMGNTQGRAAPRSAPRPPPASGTWPTASSSARRRRTRCPVAARSCGSAGSSRASTCSARRRSPRPRPTATPQRCATTRSTSSRGSRRPRDRATSPSRSPRSRRCCAPTRPSAASATPRRALRELLRHAKRARRAPAHRHGVARHARGGHRPRARAARRARVPRRPERRHRPPGLPARRARPARPAPRLRRRRRPRAPARRPPRQGRLLGPRGRRGPPARLERRRSSRRRPSRDRTFEPLTRRLLEARPRVRAGDRQPQPAQRRPRDRRQPPPRRATTTTSSSRSCAASATTSRTRSPRTGFRVRTYCPVGDLVAGMAYLVRRLLENTSNESFLQDDPRAAARSRSCSPRREARSPTSRPRAAPRAAPPAAARRAARARPASCRSASPVWIGDDRRDGDELVSTDPGDPDRVVAIAAEATPAGGRRARSQAAQRRRSAPGPRRRSRERAEILVARRRDRCASAAHALAALAVRECAQAVGRGRRRRLRGDRLPRVLRARGASSSRTTGPPLLQPPGERNELRYARAASCAVIAPWNFPLAIPLGMTAAALATGNPAILKPAEQSPGCALELVRALREAGVPARRRSRCCPARATSARRSSSTRDVATIAFTGSGAVGLEIIESAAKVRPGQRQLKRVVAEMGGKNCVIVDADADLDDAVPAHRRSRVRLRRARSARPPSRVLAHEAIADALLERLAGAVADARRSARPTRSAPTSRRSSSARRRSASSATPRGRQRERAHRRAPAPTRPGRTGWFVAPTLAADLPPGLARAHRGGLRPAAHRRGASRDVDDALRPHRRARLRAHQRPLRAQPAHRRARSPAATRSATSTSTARSPARWSAASRSAATACRAPARRPAARTTCCTSSSPAS